MYEVLKKAIQPLAKQIIRSYWILFGDPQDDVDEESAVLLLSDILDMAYCIAKDFEVEHDDFKIEKVKV